MASVQMVFGVVAPFLYQEQLGFYAGRLRAQPAVPRRHGSHWASSAAPAWPARVAPRTLAFGAFAVYGAGALVLLGGGLLARGEWLS